MIKPKKSPTLHVETLGDELSVYDWQHLQMHSLNPTAAKVFEMCDGQTSPEQMADCLNTPHAEIVVWQSLDELGKANLLQEQLVRPEGMSRRDFVKLGSAVALASIVSIVVPRPAAAQSPVGVWTVNLGTIPADFVIYYFPFQEGFITADNLADITMIVYNWSGPPAAGPGVASRLATGHDPSNGFPWAGGPALWFINSPYKVTNNDTWSGNRPYRGIAFQNTTGKDWDAGFLTVTLR